MNIRIIDRWDARRLLLIKNASTNTYDVMIAKVNLPGRMPKPLYNNFELLQHFETEAAARERFDDLKGVQ